MKLLSLLAVLFFAPVVFSAAFLPDQAAIAYPYSFNASIGASLKNTPCILTAKDKFNTTVKAWTVDGAQSNLITDGSGFLQSYVVPDDSFVNNENYTFALSCGSFRQSQMVSFEVGGSSQLNIFFLNALDWVNARPLEALLMAFAGIVVLVLAAIVVKGVAGRKTLW